MFWQSPCTIQRQIHQDSQLEQHDFRQLMMTQLGSMKTRILYIFFLMLGAIATSACQKKCQQPGAALTTFTDQEFRLVNTTDPTVKSLTNTNFETITFFKNYTGEVHKVQNNERFNDPALVFNYNVDPVSKRIRLQFSTPPSGGNNGQATRSIVTGKQIGRAHV